MQKFIYAVLAAFLLSLGVASAAQSGGAGDVPDYAKYTWGSVGGGN